MRSHRRHLRRVRTVVALALCVPLSASAGALAATPGDPTSDHPGAQVSAIVGDSPADFAQPVAPAPTAGDPPSDHAGVGDSPADFAQHVAPAPTAGDRPSDHPGVSGAPTSVLPATITVNRPERTIVQRADDTLPTALAGLALLIAVGGAGFTLLRGRVPQRGLVGRPH